MPLYCPARLSFMQKNNSLLLSIIIPVFNRPSLFTRLLRSLPSDPSCEITIINDGSTDLRINHLCDTLISQSLSTINIINNESNKGRSYCLYKGIQCSSGEYAVIMDSDDYFIDSTLDSLIRLLRVHSMDPESNINGFIFLANSDIPIYHQTPICESFVTNFTEFRVNHIPRGDLKEVFLLASAKKVCNLNLFSSYRRVPTRFIFDSISSFSNAIYIAKPLIFKQYLADGITSSLKNNFFARDMWPMFRLYHVLLMSRSYSSLSFRLTALFKSLIYFFLSVQEWLPLKHQK